MMKLLKSLTCLFIVLATLICFCSCAEEGLIEKLQTIKNTEFESQTVSPTDKETNVITKLEESSSNRNDVIVETPTGSDKITVTESTQTTKPSIVEDAVKEKTYLDFTIIDEQVLDLIVNCIAYDFSCLGYEVLDGFALVDNQWVYGLIYTNYESIEMDTVETIYGCGFAQIKDMGIGEVVLTDDVVESGVLVLSNISEEATKFVINQYAFIDPYSGIYQDSYFVYNQVNRYTVEVSESVNDCDEYREDIDLFDFDNNYFIVKANIEYNSVNAYGLYCQEAIAYKQAVETMKKIIDIQEANKSKTEQQTIIIFSQEFLDSYILSQQQESINDYLTSSISEISLNDNQLLLVTSDGINVVDIPTDNKPNAERITNGAIKIISNALLVLGAVSIAIVTGGAGAPVVVSAIIYIAAGVSVVYGLSESVEGVSDVFLGIKGDTSTPAFNPGVWAYEKIVKDSKVAKNIYSVVGVGASLVTFILSPGNIVFKASENVLKTVGKIVLTNAVKIAIVGVASVSAATLSKFVVTSLTKSVVAGEITGFVVGVAVAILVAKGIEGLEKDNKFIFKDQKTKVPSSTEGKPASTGFDKKIANARGKAGKIAKQRALNDIINGTDMHGLDPTIPDDYKIIEFIQTNHRFPSYAAGDGMQCDFAHGVDVSAIKKAYYDGAITEEQALSFVSNPQNGMLTSRTTHYKILHGGSWYNETDYMNIINQNPASKDAIMSILSYIGK